MILSNILHEFEGILVHFQLSQKLRQLYHNIFQTVFATPVTSNYSLEVILISLERRNWERIGNVDLRSSNRVASA